MRYLKKIFESKSEYYHSITFEDWCEFEAMRFSFYKEVKIIKQLIVDSKDIVTPNKIDKVKDNLDDSMRIYFTDSADSGLYSCRGSIVVYKSTDEWYYASIEYPNKHKRGKESQYHIRNKNLIKCDQLDGLIELIKDIETDTVKHD